MASDARSDREGAGPDRPNRDTRDVSHTSSRKEAERSRGEKTRERIETEEQQGQRERERSGS